MNTTADEDEIIPPPSLKSLLIRFPCFTNLNDLELRHIIENSDRCQLKAGEILVNQGEYYDQFCIVLSGEINAVFETDRIK